LKRLKSFSYFEPANVIEAIKILAEQGSQAYPLAGGTDLLVRMKRGDITPTALVNLKRIRGLDQIKKESEKGISIGALTSISAIENSPLIQSSHPVLVEAAGVLGSPSIRNLGTLGGNIGRASPASDMAPSLIILQARVVIEGLNGKRELDIENFFLGPGATTLSPGDLITSFFLSEMVPKSAAVYLKFGRREGPDCALVGVAVLLELSGKKNEAREARVALSSVAPVPLRAKKTEKVLLSGPLNEDRIKEAARVAAEESSPITDIRATDFYRKEMVMVLTFRAVLKALALAEKGNTGN
jgi:CO/xanthine dehydrogenase FAD-binding subunit